MHWSIGLSIGHAQILLWDAWLPERGNCPRSRFQRAALSSQVFCLPFLDPHASNRGSSNLIPYNSACDRDTGHDFVGSDRNALMERQRHFSRGEIRDLVSHDHVFPEKTSYNIHLGIQTPFFFSLLSILLWPVLVPSKTIVPVPAPVPSSCTEYQARLGSRRSIEFVRSGDHHPNGFGVHQSLGT